MPYEGGGDGSTLEFCMMGHGLASTKYLDISIKSLGVGDSTIFKVMLDPYPYLVSKVTMGNMNYITRWDTEWLVINGDGIFEDPLGSCHFLALSFRNTS